MLKSFFLNGKILLNIKYIKAKYNSKLKTTFFKLFIYSVKKQVYKLEFTKKLKINNAIYISFIKKDIIKKYIQMKL